jgi:hypothetical protein
MSRQPLLPYTFDLHTGSSGWTLEKRPWSLYPSSWVLCNGQRLDMRTVGYPRPYMDTSAAVLFLRLMDERERRVRLGDLALREQLLRWNPDQPAP